MFKDFKLEISKDGRSIIGRKIQEPKNKTIATSAPIGSEDSNTKESKTAPESTDFKVELINVWDEISEIEKDRKTFTESEAIYKKCISKWQKNKPFYIFGSGAFGCFLGIVIGTYKTAQLVTVTTFASIIIAAAICLCASIIGLTLFASLSYIHVTLMMKYYKKKLRITQRIIKRLEASKNLHDKKALELANHLYKK